MLAPEVVEEPTAEGIERELLSMEDATSPDPWLPRTGRTAQTWQTSDRWLGRRKPSLRHAAVRDGRRLVFADEDRGQMIEVHQAPSAVAGESIEQARSELVGEHDPTDVVASHRRLEGLLGGEGLAVVLVEALTDDLQTAIDEDGLGCSPHEVAAEVEMVEHAPLEPLLAGVGDGVDWQDPAVPGDPESVLPSGTYVVAVVVDAQRQHDARRRRRNQQAFAEPPVPASPTRELAEHPRGGQGPNDTGQCGDHEQRHVAHHTKGQVQEGERQQHEGVASAPQPRQERQHDHDEEEPEGEDRNAREEGELLAAAERER